MKRRSIRTAGAALVATIAALSETSAHAVPRAGIVLPAGVKTGDTVELANGQKVSAQRYQEELNQLQEAMERGGFSLRKSDGRAPKGKILAFPGQDREAAEDRVAFAARLAKVRARQAAGFKELVKARTKIARPGAVVSPGRGASGGGGGALEPKEDPLSLAYEEALGKKDKAAIYVAFGLEDRGDADSVGCEAGLEGGVYLFEEKRPLAKAVLKGAVKDGSASGGLELYLVGKMVDGFPKSGSQKLPALKKSINPPEIKYAYGMPPITIQIAVAVGGELGVTLDNRQTGPTSGAKGSCTVGVVPSVRASARATASVAAIAYKIGVEGNVTLLDMSLPATATIALKSNPLSFQEDFDASLDTKFLDGSLGFFVQTNIPKQGEKLWDVDWDTIYKKTFFEWDGFKAKETLAHFAAKQTPFE